MINFKGAFTIEHYRGSDLLNQYVFSNGVTDEGINTIFDVYFNSAVQSTAWYLGLINNANPGDLSASDTMASHSGWNEAQGYTEANRPQWTSGAASNKKVTNSAYVTFSINATATISGLFLTNDNTKGGSSGILWSTGIFTNGNIDVQASDTLRVTYTVEGAAN